MSIKKLLRPLASPSLLRFYHKNRAILATLLYGFPSRKLKIIGVTGTNGKTTTAHLIGAIFTQAGYKVAVASTVSFQIGDTRETNALNMTTPDPFVMQKFLAKAVSEGAHIAVIETTSHAIDQQRIWGLKYDTVVLTNVTHDHLDYHGTFDAYRATKLKLFGHNPRFAIINADDSSAGLFLAQPAYQQYTYGIDTKADVTARKLLLEPTGTLFTAVTPVGQVAIDLPLPGKFNVANALAALSVGIAQGIGLDIIKEGLEHIGTIPGRMERVDVGQDFTVIVDYAHTPDAFEQIYSTLKPVVRGRLIHVFGATGDRDKTKRPIMGALAGRFADLVVLTTDEPYTEDPKVIIEDIVKGVKRGRPGLKNITKKPGPKESGEQVWWWRMPDRKDAIKFALSMGRKADVILISGMGAEKFMVVPDGRGGIKRIPWNERRIVKELLLAQLQNK